ncbi:hypothetical protein PG990_005691 [Apiospora arundinis]
MSYSQEQMDAARGLRDSFGATQPPRSRRGNNGQSRGSYNGQSRGSYNGQSRGSYNGQSRGSYNGQSRGSYNGQSRGSYNGPIHGSNSGPYGSASGSYFASAPGSGSTTSATTHQFGGNFPASSNNPQSTNGPGYGSYGSPGTPRAPRPVPATTSSNNVANGGPNLNTGHNEDVTFGARTGNETSYTHQPAHFSSTSVAEPNSKPYGGLASSRYATTTASSSTAMSSSFQPSGGSHANVATGANNHVGQSAHSATVAQGPQHSGLVGSWYSNTSGSALSTVPLTPQPNNGNSVSVDMNGHASPAVQPSTASQTPQLSSAFTLTSANGFGVGLHSNGGTPLGSSHIRGNSNNSDVQMIDLDTPVQAEGVLPLRLHGGMHDSRWARPAPSAPVHNYGVSSQSPATNVSPGASASPSNTTPSDTTPSNGLSWRTSETWNLAKYQNGISTKGNAEEVSQPSESGTEPSRPGLHQGTSGTATRGGLGGSRFAQ